MRQKNKRASRPVRQLAGAEVIRFQQEMARDYALAPVVAYVARSEKSRKLLAREGMRVLAYATVEVAEAWVNGMGQSLAPAYRALKRRP